MRNLNKLFITLIVAGFLIICASAEASKNKASLPQLQDNEELTFKFDKNNTEYKFKTFHDGKNLRFIKIFCEKNFQIKCHAIHKDKSPNLRIRYSKNFDTELGKVALFADIPQDRSEYEWEINVSNRQLPNTVKVKMVKSFPIEVATFSKAISGIMIKNVPMTEVEANPESDTYTYPVTPYYNSSNNRTADMTPEGDAIIWVAPGIWRLSVKSQNKKDKGILSARLIPAYPGKLTVVKWPDNLGKFISPPKIVKNAKLNINLAKIEKDIGKIDFTVLESSLVTPDKRNTEVTQGAKKVDIIDIKRLKTPINTVLLLDSSGSMKHDMKQVIKEAISFVKNFDKKANISVVDFDTKPKPIKAKTRKSLIKKLKKVRANGATALYDSVLLGLKRLNGKQRASLILFTDGKDANYNDTKQGSKASAKQMFDAVKSDNIPVYTIGYGKSPDNSTLNRISELSGGTYYKANKKNLDEVFEKIKKNLGNSFELTYKLPKIQVSGNDPILLVMLDKSGSMNADSTECDGCAHRIEKVRQALTDFISKAPKNVILEFGTFNTSTKIDQIATKDKAKIIRAISNVEAGGGTDSLLAMKDSFNALSVPSNKKYLIFITDAALKAPTKRQEEFDLTLNKIKDSGIKSIWVGIGVDDKYKKLFDHAAKVSGGKSLMAKKPNDLTDMFSKVLEDLGKSKENASKITVGISVKHKTTEGLPVVFSDSKMIDKPKDIEQQGKAVSLDTLSYDFKNLKTPYANSSGSKLIWGNDIALKEVRINSKIPLDIDARTKAVNIHINNIYLLSRLRGFRQSDKVMVAMDIDMTNVLEKQKVVTYPNGSSYPSSWFGKANAGGVEKMMTPPYLIPDLTSHLYMRWNNSAEYPISHATWLTEKPFILPSDNSVYLKPSETVSGAIVFMVPEGEMKNVSLHYYDSAYGNVDIPLIGKMTLRSQEKLKGTDSNYKKLSDTFAMKVSSYSDTNSVAGIKLEGKKLFRTVSVEIKSKVEALLKLNPSERIFMRISTPLGWLIQNIHPVTKNVPFGFYSPTVLTPGSFNKENLVFIIPELLKNNHADLVVSLMGKDVILPINTIPECKSKLGKPTASEDGIDLVVNSVKYLKRLDGYSERLVAVDVTFVDKENNTETRLHKPLFLSTKDKVEKESENNAKKSGLGNFSSGKTNSAYKYSVDDITDTRIFGLRKKQVIKDGYAQRLIALFKCSGDEKDLYLLSPIFKNLKYKINYKEILKKQLFQKDSPLLAKKVEFETKNDRCYEQEILDKLKKITVRRAANGFVKPGAKTLAKVSVDGKKEVVKESCPVPAMTIYGIEKFKNLNSLEAVKKEIAKLQYISNGEDYSLYSPAAILSQGFGNALDFMKLIVRVLQKKPVDITTYEIILSDEGKQYLKDTYKITKSPSSIYAIKVGSGKDARKLVVPMLKYADEIPAYIKKIRKGYSSAIDSANVSMAVSVVAKKVADSVNMQMGGMASALGGSSKSSEKEFKLCEWRENTDFLSNHAIDIAFAKSSDNKVRAVIYGTEDGTIVSKKTLPKDYKAQKIKIYISNDTVGYSNPYEYELAKGSKVTDNFFTLGINIPSLSKDAIKALNERREAKKKSVKNPDTLSILQWHTRTILSKFIANQSMYEADIAKELGIIQGRSDTSRVIIVGVAKNSKKGILQTRLDLKYIKNVPQSENKEAIKAFNIMTGLLNTITEATVLGKNGMSVASLWSMVKDKKIVTITSKNCSALYKLMKDKGYSKCLLERLRSLRSNTVILLPCEAAVIDGKPYWGWLEINKDDYSIQSIMQNSEHGAVESTIMNALANSGQAVVGFLKGVETSVWSVSALSFDETDYKKLLEKAKKLAMGLKGRLNNIGKSFTDIIGDALTLKKSSGTPAGGTKISLIDLIKDKKFLQYDAQTLDFSSGFEAGINYYFDHANKN